MPDIRTHVVLRSEESNGVVSVIDNTVPAHTIGPFLHKHDFDEAFYLLEGELVFQVEDQLVTILEWLARYQWWAVGISIGIVVLVNLRNLRRG